MICYVTKRGRCGPDSPQELVRSRTIVEPSSHSTLKLTLCIFMFKYATITPGKSFYWGVNSTTYCCIQQRDFEVNKGGGKKGIGCNSQMKHFCLFRLVSAAPGTVLGRQFLARINLLNSLHTCIFTRMCTVARVETDISNGDGRFLSKTRDSERSWLSAMIWFFFTSALLIKWHEPESALRISRIIRYRSPILDRLELVPWRFESLKFLSEICTVSPSSWRSLNI